MKHFNRFLKTSFLIAATSALLLGCNDEKLTPIEKLYLFDPGFANVEAHFCTQPAQTIRQKLKYIFVMDKSKSNQSNETTDPTGTRRYAALRDFLNNSVDNPGYTFYGLINFADSSTVVNPQAPYRLPAFSDDRLAFMNMVNQEWNKRGVGMPQDPPPDSSGRPQSGFTNYVSALTAVEAMIKADVDAEKTSIDPLVVGNVYTIIFVSDGYPLIEDPLSPTGVRAQDYNAEIRPIIDRVLKMKTADAYKAYIDSITLHTGYYFETRDVAAENLLAQMAAFGGGKSYTFGSGLNIDYSAFAVPVRSVRYLLTDLFLENASTVWWDDGRLLHDEDGDGLPDEIEGRVNSNLNLKDSDGNGVSDLVEFRTKGKPCKDDRCTPTVGARDNYAACQALMPLTKPDGSPNSKPDPSDLLSTATVYFADRDQDGLNDCEEWLLRADRDSFDSNSDHVPDWLALKNQIPYILGMNGISADPDSDTMSNYAEIKAGMPTFLDNRQVMNIKPQDMELSREDKGQEGVDCFMLKVKNVSTLGGGNLIKIHLIENTSVVDDKPILRVAQGRLNGNATSINFSQGDFK